MSDRLQSISKHNRGKIAVCPRSPMQVADVRRSPVHLLNSEEWCRRLSLRLGCLLKMTCAGYLTHPSFLSVRMRTCWLHPNGIPCYRIFYFLDIGHHILDSTTECTSNGWNSILDRINGITLSPGHFFHSQRFVDSNP